ncbi:MAG: type ISP restriction/modification enzyme [Pyrinomonadaceae bacterium]
MHEEFDSFIPIGDKAGKADDNLESAIFNKYGIGISTNRDTWAYNYSKDNLLKNMDRFIETYNSEVVRFQNKLKSKEKISIDNFVLNDDTKIKWSSRLKECLSRFEYAEYSKEKVRVGLYRPYCSQFIYFDRILIHRVSQFPHIFSNVETENKLICVTAVGNKKPFQCLATNVISDLHLTGDSQCFPFYIYNEDGSNRCENITDWALEQFQTHYNDKQISKWDIFYYTYALLHHPEYREKYEANLKRELPRIPYAPEFHKFAEAGKKLADLHINYETQAEYPLEMIENESEQVDWRVEKMKYNKDKTQIVYNDFLTLAGIPPEAYEYHLGNRSALDWIVDQYQVSTDKRSDITNDPNRENDKQYIVRLVKKIVTVSLETVKIVKTLSKI